MDAFETIIKTVLEAEGYWVRPGFVEKQRENHPDLALDDYLALPDLGEKPDLASKIGARAVKAT